MANNPYVNKVVYGSSTLIDISDTTATASDVASGKYFYTAAGQKVQGTASSGSIIVSDTTDSHGGTIKTITTGQTLNLQSKSVTPTSSQQTVTPDAGYNGLSEVIVGAVSGGYITQDANGHIILPPDGDVPRLITKSITQNGTYAASSDNASGYSSVTVNVSGGGTNIGTSTYSSAYAQSDLYFENLSGEPRAFFVYPTTATVNLWEGNGNIYYRAVTVAYDGTTTSGNYYYSMTIHYSTDFSFVYSNGSLEIYSSGNLNTAPGNFYPNVTYTLVYIY